MVTSTDTRNWNIGKSSLLALALLGAAVASFAFFGSKIAGCSFLFSAVMAWDQPFEENRAKGKPTASNNLRVIIGLIFVLIGAASLILSPLTVESPRSSPTIDASDAATICEDAARERIAHPSTADFSILAIGFRAYDDGTAIFATTFTARNSFNLKLEFNLACDFSGKQMTDIKIVEAS